MLDVVKEVFSRSGRKKLKTQRGIMAFETHLFYGKHVFIYMGPEALILQEVHKMKV